MVFVNKEAKQLNLITNSLKIVLNNPYKVIANNRFSIIFRNFFNFIDIEIKPYQVNIKTCHNIPLKRQMQQTEK